MTGTITHDFTTLDAADAITNWRNIGTWATNPAVNNDILIQGTNAIFGRCSANKAFSTAIVTSFNATTKHVFVWLKCVTWPAQDTKANGGLRLCLSSDTTPTLTGTGVGVGPTNSKSWYLDGSDTKSTEGWICYVVDTSTAGDLSLGSATMTAIISAGIGSNTVNTVGAGSVKPQNIFWDIMKFGTGLTINNGTSGTPIAFSDIFSADSTNAYGVLTKQSGIFYGAGKMIFGTSSQSAVTYFLDINKVLVYQDFPVANTFYEIKLVGASGFRTTLQLGNIASGVTSGGCTLKGAGSAVWTLNVSDAFSDLNLYGGTFTEMRRATLQSTSNVKFCSFVNIGEITTNGAVIEDSSFNTVVTAAPTSGTWALIINSTTEMSAVQRCTFISCNKAIKLTTAGTYSFNGIKLSNNTFDVDANFTPTTADSYVETNQDATTSLQNTSATSGVGQSFTGNGGTLSSCRFYLKKTGSPTGTAVAKVYAHSGTFGTSSIPTGSALATSETLTVSSLTTSYVLTELKFKGANNITLTNTTKYVLTIEYSSGSSGNTLDVGKDTSAPTHAGNGSSFASSTWTAASGTDYCFYLYTGGAVIINVTGGGSTPTYTEAVGVSVTVNNAVTLTVTVNDILGVSIQNARVAIYKTSDNTEITNQLTNSSGIVSLSYAYISDTAIYIRVRKTSTGVTRYINNDSSGTITTDGFSSTITLLTDTIAAP